MTNATIKVTLQGFTNLNPTSNRFAVLALLAKGDRRFTVDQEAFVKTASDQRRKVKLSKTQVRMALHHLSAFGHIAINRS